MFQRRQLIDCNRKQKNVAICDGLLEKQSQLYKLDIEADGATGFTYR